jgi:signal peptidase I
VRGFFFESLETVLLALAVFLVLQASVQNFRVEGTSMDPTLVHGQYLLVNKLVYEPIPFKGDENPADQRWFIPLHAPQQADVIVFHEPAQDSDLVKRVIGVPGDLVEIRLGVVYVNGIVLPEPYLVRRDTSNHPPEVVQQGFYFVLGDNRPVSYDSRELGPIPLENIIGKAWFTYWPLSEMDILGADLGMFR